MRTGDVLVKHKEGLGPVNDLSYSLGVSSDCWLYIGQFRIHGGGGGQWPNPGIGAGCTYAPSQGTQITFLSYACVFSK